jgi:hypothetical protein
MGKGKGVRGVGNPAKMLRRVLWMTTTNASRLQTFQVRKVRIVTQLFPFQCRHYLARLNVCPDDFFPHMLDHCEGGFFPSSQHLDLLSLPWHPQMGYIPSLPVQWPLVDSRQTQQQMAGLDRVPVFN